MNIVFCASEAVPYCKTGGLADVAGALPKALIRKGATVSLFLPYYRAVRETGVRVSRVLQVRGADILKTEGDGYSAYFVDRPDLFDREGLYGPPGGAFQDNAQRYSFFSRVVIDASRELGLKPDVYHCHDWQTSLIPVYLKTLYPGRVRTLLTIHNLAYQGVFPKEVLAPADLTGAAKELEHFDQVSFLKGGLVCADALNAVSPTYAEEIQTEAYGFSLEGLLASRRGDLTGVLNGLDSELWDPSRDQALAQVYPPGQAVSGKAACKAALQKECGLEVDPDTLLLGSVSRFDYQKGLDVALEFLPGALEEGAQFAVIGMGDPGLEERFRQLAGLYPRKVRYHATFDDPFARRVYAGADVFLMPSRFEPCGLGQMIAMRYGTLPLATRTGGLSDTVPPHGFLAERPEVGALREALEEVRRVFAEKDVWAQRVRTAMSVDFSWDNAAEEYLKLYAKVMGPE